MHDAEIYKLKLSICSTGAGAKQLPIVNAVLDTAAGAVFIPDSSLPRVSP
jgi:hypothetical protein